MDSRDKVISIATDLLNYKNAAGESQLFAAAKTGDINHVKQLLQFPYLDLEAICPPGKTASQIAEEKGHIVIACLIELAYVGRLNEETGSFITMDPCVQQIFSSPDQQAEIKTDENKPFLFWQYANTTRKIPDANLFIIFLKEMKKSLSEPVPELKEQLAIVEGEVARPDTFLTASGRSHIEARKTWSDIVSATYQKNFRYTKNENVKNQVIRRLEKLGHKTNPEKIYEKCIYALQYHSAIVVTLDLGFLKNNTLSAFQLLNLFEKGGNANYQQGSPKCDDYKTSRLAFEEVLFQGLNDEMKMLEDRRKNNIHASPRYAALRLLDRNNCIEKLGIYGKSYVVLQDVVKLNALFGPDNVYNLWTKSKVVSLSSFHFLEILLLQSSDTRLNALVNRVTKGCLPTEYKQYSAAPEEEFIAVLLPAINMLDPGMVQHIHIDPKDYKLTEKDRISFSELGITVTNSEVNPYPDLCARFMKAIEEYDIQNTITLLSDYPSLMRITNGVGYHPVHIAAARGYVDIIRILVKAGADINAVTPLNKTPLDLAIENNHIELVRALLDMPKVNIIHPENTNETILTNAVEKNDVEMVRLILERCRHSSFAKKMISFINHKKENGESALFIAASRGDAEKAAFLLGIKGIDLEARRVPGDGKTALQIAEEKNHPEIARLIRDAQDVFMQKMLRCVQHKKSPVIKIINESLAQSIRIASVQYSYNSFQELVVDLENRGIEKNSLVKMLKESYPVNMRNLSCVLGPVDLAVYCQKDMNYFLEFISTALELSLPHDYLNVFIKEALSHISCLFRTTSDETLTVFLQSASLALSALKGGEMKESHPLELLELLNNQFSWNKYPEFIATLSADEIYLIIGEQNSKQAKNMAKLIHQMESFPEKRLLLKKCLKNILITLPPEAQANLFSHVFSDCEIQNNTAANDCLQNVKTYLKTATKPKRIEHAVNVMYLLMEAKIDNAQIKAIFQSILSAKNIFQKSGKLANHLDAYLNPLSPPAAVLAAKVSSPG